MPSKKTTIMDPEANPKPAAPLAPSDTCGAICPEWLNASGQPCFEPKGHAGDLASPHCANVAGHTAGIVISSWIEGARRPLPR